MYHLWNLKLPKSLKFMKNQFHKKIREIDICGGGFHWREWDEFQISQIQKGRMIYWKKNRLFLFAGGENDGRD